MWNTLYTDSDDDPLSLALESDDDSSPAQRATTDYDPDVPEEVPF